MKRRQKTKAYGSRRKKGYSKVKKTYYISRGGIRL